MAQRIIGTVKWWNSSKGYGFFTQQNGPDVFAHFAELKMDGFKNLTEGQQVEFSIEKGPKGPQAMNIIPVNQENKSPIPTPIQEKKSPIPVPIQESPSFFSKTQVKFSQPINQSYQGLRVFLCHSSNDKPLVRKLYQQLKSDNFDPWLDEEKLLAGQDWRQEITKAVRKADVVIVCLSRGSVGKAGFVQKEIKDALDIADEQPEGTIFLIPLKLEECEVPDRLSRWQWVNYFNNDGYKRLLNALQARASTR